MRVAFVLAASIFTLTACGGSGAGDTTGGSGGSPLVKPQAPHLDVVKPMAAVLHVQWTEVAPCDMVMAERKDDQHPTYAAAFQINGVSTSHMDGDAAMNMTYTYRLQCMVGDAVSDYSNEMGANPTVMSP
jgi:hypothetical protein